MNRVLIVLTALLMSLLPAVASAQTIDADAGSTQSAGAALWLAVPAPPGGESLGMQWVAIKNADGGTITAAVARPTGDGPFPVVVILHGSHGLATQYIQLANDLAKGGFIAVAGCWFGGRDGQPQSDPIECADGPAKPDGPSPQAFREVNSVVSAARTLPGARADWLGLFGHSLGGMAALIYSSGWPSVQAVVADSSGYPDGLVAKVGQLVAPLLITHGTSDRSDPTTYVQRAQAYEAAARTAGKSVEAVYYPRADHNDVFLAPAHYADEVARMTAFYSRTLQ